MKIKKGDTVLIITGKDRGKKAKVIKAHPREGKITVEGVNLIRKYVRSNRPDQPSQKVEIPKPIDVSNVKLICPKCGQPTRVGYQVTEAGKYRVCKKCGGEI